MRQGSSKVEKTNSQAAVFITMALDMSWRLALVVILPVVGGFKLDEKFDSAPTLTIIGFALAMVGTAVVLWQALQAANRLPVPKLTADNRN